MLIWDKHTVDVPYRVNPHKLHFIFYSITGCLQVHCASIVGEVMVIIRLQVIPWLAVDQTAFHRLGIPFSCLPVVPAQDKLTPRRRSYLHATRQRLLLEGVPFWRSIKFQPQMLRPHLGLCVVTFFQNDPDFSQSNLTDLVPMSQDYHSTILYT